MKILLVDDNEFVRTLIAGQLDEAGYEVSVASGADEALAALADGGFSLLIADIIMPGKDGGQLMKAVRQQGIDLPILAITGGVENAQEDYAHYADLFADRTMVKPVGKDDLLAAVKELIGS